MRRMLSSFASPRLSSRVLAIEIACCVTPRSSATVLVHLQRLILSSFDAVVSSFIRDEVLSGYDVAGADARAFPE